MGFLENVIGLKAVLDHVLEMMRHHLPEPFSSNDHYKSWLQIIAKRQFTQMSPRYNITTVEIDP